MAYILAILWGLVQGLTEILPVSGSAHMQDDGGPDRIRPLINPGQGDPSGQVLQQTQAELPGRDRPLP